MYVCVCMCTYCSYVHRWKSHLAVACNLQTCWVKDWSNFFGSKKVKFWGLEPTFLRGLQLDIILFNSLGVRRKGQKHRRTACQWHFVHISQLPQCWLAHYPVHCVNLNTEGKKEHTPRNYISRLIRYNNKNPQLLSSVSTKFDDHCSY